MLSMLLYPTPIMTAHLPESTESHRPQPSAKKQTAPIETEQSSLNTQTEENGEKSNVHIQKYLQQGITEALEKSEKFTQHMEKQAKWFKLLAIGFAGFSACLQVRQVFVGNLGSQQERKFSAWEMVQNVQDAKVTTSAGLAIALTTLSESCEPLAGIDLTGKYLPSLKLSPPTLSNIDHGLTFISSRFLGVAGQHKCGLDHQPIPIDLRGIKFDQAKLQKATFTNANLIGSSFQEANLTGVEFIESNPRNIRLKDPLLDLEKTNFQRTNLNNVKFNQSNLKNANFRGAILLGTDLRESKGLTNEQLEGDGSPFLCDSKLPPNVLNIDGEGRDCDKIAQALHETYPKEFTTIDAAQIYVAEKRDD